MGLRRNRDTVISMKPIHPRSLRLLGVASFSTLALTLAACGTNGPSGNPESTVYGSDSSKPSNAANAGGNGGVREGSSQENRSDNQAQGHGVLSNNGGIGLCKTDQLQIAVSPEQGAAGTSYYNIVFTNKGQSECTLKGFPGVSLVKDNNGSQIGRSAKREEGTRHQPVVLQPGKQAVANLGITRAELHGDSCMPVQSDGLRVYPPEETHAAYVPFKATGCEGSVETLKIQPVQPFNGDGSGASKAG